MSSALSYNLIYLIPISKRCSFVNCPSTPHIPLSCKWLKDSLPLLGTGRSGHFGFSGEENFKNLLRPVAIALASSADFLLPLIPSRKEMKGVTSGCVRGKRGGGGISAMRLRHCSRLWWFLLLHQLSLNNFLETWLSMLLMVIDFTAKNEAQCLQKFTSLKTRALTTMEHKKALPGLVNSNLL